MSTMSERGRLASTRGRSTSTIPGGNSSYSVGPQCVSLDADPAAQLELKIDDIRQVIREVAKKPSVTSLSLQGNIIPSRSMTLLSNYLSSNKTIKSLNLAQCSLGDESAMILLKGCLLRHGGGRGASTGLQSLDLSFNQITDAFCSQVRKYGSQLSIRRLNLGFNPVTLKGLNDLISFGSILSTVDLRYCVGIPATAATIKVIKGNLNSKPCLRHLCLDGLGFKKADADGLKHHLETHDLLNVVQVGLGKAAGPLPQVTKSLKSLLGIVEKEEEESAKGNNEGEDQKRDEKEDEVSEEPNSEEKQSSPEGDENKTSEESENSVKKDDVVDDAGSKKEKEEEKETPADANHGQKEDQEPQSSSSQASQAKETSEEEGETAAKEEGEASGEKEEKRDQEEQDPVKAAREAQLTIISEIASVDGAIKVVRVAPPSTAFEKRRRSRSVSRQFQPKEVDRSRPAPNSSNTTGSRSASVSSYYSAGRQRGGDDVSRAGSGSPDRASSVAQQQHVDPSSAFKLLIPSSKKWSQRSCDAAPRSYSQDKKKKETTNDDAKSDRAEEEQQEEEELYVAPEQPSLVPPRTRGRSVESRRSASRAGSEVSTPNTPRQWESSDEYKPKPPGQQEVKTQLRRGKLAKLFLDKCSADDDQACLILNLESTDPLQAGYGDLHDCPDELVAVSGVPSELEVMPMHDNKRILGLAKLLFFIIYTPGERMPLDKVVRMNELPPSFRQLSKEEQAKYRSGRSVEDTTVRKELMNILGGDGSSPGGRSGSQATMASRSASTSSRSGSRSGGGKIQPRYLDHYRKEKQRKEEDHERQMAQSATASNYSSASRSQVGTQKSTSTNNNNRSSMNGRSISKVALAPPRK